MKVELRVRVIITLAHLHPPILAESLRQLLRALPQVSKDAIGRVLVVFWASAVSAADLYQLL